MPLNFQQLVNEFIAGASAGTTGGGANLKIVGNQLIHYGTPIAERSNEKFIVNITRYSFVTGRLQKILKESIPSDLYVEVRGIPLGHKGPFIQES